MDKLTDYFNSALEKRREHRQKMVERLIIQVHDHKLKETFTGDTMSCQSRDRSSSGLQLCTPVQLPTGTRIDLWVKIHDRTKPFLLDGEIRWSRLDEKHGYFCNGVELVSIEGSDFESWLEFATTG